MGILIRKHFNQHRFTGIGKLAIISLIVALSASIIDTIWAVYLYSFVKNASIVGFISAALTLVSFISYFFFIPLIERSSKSKLFSRSLLLFAAAYIIFSFTIHFYLILLLAVAITSLYTIRITSWGLIIKDESPNKQLAVNEGLIYTFLNIAWFIGPLIAALMLAKFGDDLGTDFIFIFSAFLIFLAFLIFKFSKIKDIHIKKRTDKKIIKNFINFFKSKTRVSAYILSGGVSLWWTLIYLFIPLYIIKKGLPESYVGYFLFAVAFPLIISMYKF